MWPGSRRWRCRPAPAPRGCRSPSSSSAPRVPKRDYSGWPESWSACSRGAATPPSSIPKRTPSRRPSEFLHDGRGAPSGTRDGGDTGARGGAGTASRRGALALLMMHLATATDRDHMDRLVVRGAREHNLKDVHIDLPRDALIVFTGLSGSGKSSLAFDTIFAEGQRRYVESLSAYARQFLGQMDKPDVDFIEGLSPAVSIDQKSTNRNPRSTVGTITEVYDYLRLLYARAGQPHCPNCGKPISR